MAEPCRSQRDFALWTNVFSSGWQECRGSTGAHWLTVDFQHGAGWERPGKAIICACHHSLPDSLRNDHLTLAAEVSIDDLWRALDLAIARGYTDPCTGQRIHENMTWDPCAGDIVLQLAVLGDVLYDLSPSPESRRQTPRTDSGFPT